MHKSENLEQERYPKFESFEEMKESLLEYHPLRSKFKMILLIGDTEEKNNIITEFEKNFSVLDKKSFYKIKIENSNTKRVDFLGYLKFLKVQEHIQFFILFTYSTSRQIKKYLINHFLNKNHRINLLWLNHKLTTDLLDFMDKFNTEIIDIKGTYSPSFEIKSKLRPNFKRKIRYQGGDALDSYYELNDLYGINIEEFSGKIDNKEFQFKRKDAIFSFKQGDLLKFLEISEWIINKSSQYLGEIRKFKKKVHESLILNRDILLSNYLSVKFENMLTSEILKEMIKELQKSTDIEIISVISNDDINRFENLEEDNQINEFYYRLRIINPRKDGIFTVEISQKSAVISQIFDTNFTSVFPILDFLDYTQPKNEILVLDN